MSKSSVVVVIVLCLAGLCLAGCGSAPEPVVKEVVVEQQVPVEVPVTRLVEVEKEVEVTREVVVEVAPAFDAAAEEGILQALADEVYRAFQEADFDAVEQYLAADWELFSATAMGGTRVSRGMWLQHVRENWPAGSVTINVNNAEWMVTAEMAVSKSLETWTYPEIVIQYNTTTVYEKVDGQWMVVLVHQSYVG